MSSLEFTEWIEWYRAYDQMKAGRVPSGEGHERGDDIEA